jgi:transposase
MEAIPLRFRQRIIELYDQGLQTRQIAEMLGTCHSGTRRIRQYLRERGTLEPAKPRGGYDSGLTEPLRRQLRALVSADPGATRQELRDRLNVSVDVRTVGRWLKKLGLVLKKSRCTRPSRTVPMFTHDARHGTIN